MTRSMTSRSEPASWLGSTKHTIHDHQHTPAVSLARAGMPFHLLAEQLGHAKIQMTMRYAKFRPAYADVGPYFSQVAEILGLSGDASGHTSSQTEAGATARPPKAPCF